MSTTQKNGNLQTKRYLCLMCLQMMIVESRVEHRLPSDEVPDVGGCDYSTYTDYKIIGGRLLEKRSDIPWQDSEISRDPDFTTRGGICNECLKNDVIKDLVPHINFAKEPEKK